MILTGDAVGDVVAEHDAVLVAVPRAAADEPHVGQLGVAIDDEVLIDAVFALADPRVDQGLLRQVTVWPFGVYSSARYSASSADPRSWSVRPVPIGPPIRPPFMAAMIAAATLPPLARGCEIRLGARAPDPVVVHPASKTRTIAAAACLLIVSPPGGKPAIAHGSAASRHV